MAPSRALDLACGVNKRVGAIGMDLYRVPGVDVVANFDHLPLPFRSDVFDEVYGSHVIEHAQSLVGLLVEVHRIAKAGARIFFTTPHYSAHGSWGDPTHRWHLSTRTFTYFGEGHGFMYYTHGRYRTVSLTVTFPSVWRTLGVQWLVNLENRYPGLRFLRKFWEEYLAFVVRAKEMRVVLEVVKDPSPSK